MGTHILEAGDVIKRRKGIFEHVGLFIGNNLVFHNTPEKGEHVSSFAEFSDGHEVTLLKTAGGKKNGVLERARNAINSPRPYNAFNNNCEHTVNRVFYGESKSPQLVVFCLLAVIVFGVILSAKS